MVQPKQYSSRHDNYEAWLFYHETASSSGLFLSWVHSKKAHFESCDCVLFNDKIISFLYNYKNLKITATKKKTTSNIEQTKDVNDYQTCRRLPAENWKPPKLRFYSERLNGKRWRHERALKYITCEGSFNQEEGSVVPKALKTNN